MAHTWLILGTSVDAVQGFGTLGRPRSSGSQWKPDASKGHESCISFLMEELPMNLRNAQGHNTTRVPLRELAVHILYSWEELSLSTNTTLADYPYTGKQIERSATACLDLRPMNGASSHRDFAHYFTCRAPTSPPSQNKKKAISDQLGIRRKQALSDFLFQLSAMECTNAAKHKRQTAQATIPTPPSSPELLVDSLSVSSRGMLILFNLYPIIVRGDECELLFVKAREQHCGAININ
eukprot:scaffold256915_cov37-Tisochrysis_lutea.AAC.2